MTREKILFQLDDWVSDKGNGGYVHIDFNPYPAMHNNFLNEEIIMHCGIWIKIDIPQCIIIS